MSDEKPSISPRENGPFVVRNVKILRLEDGSLAEEKPVRALCRCGASKNKPFCDGAHKDIGFDSTPGDVSSQDRVFVYEGRETTVYFNRLLCSRAGECVRRLGAVFDRDRDPWVMPDNATPEEVAEAVAACPSGALRLSEPGGEPRAIHDDEVSITVERDGPYRVRNIPVEAPYWAEGQSAHKYVLCRCGLSKNKPFCDGSHDEAGWKSGN